MNPSGNFNLSESVSVNPIGGTATSRTPPPHVPLMFLFSSIIFFGVGGIVTFFYASFLIHDPTDDKSVADVHLYLLGFITMGILGALHQFSPVITLEKLYSIKLAYFTYGLYIIGIILLPLGLILGSEALTAFGGASLGTSIVTVIVNLSRPLLKGKKSVSRLGLRISITYLLITACFGVTFASTHNSFSPPTHLVLAHASFGLIGWAGISYIAVSERLWPMFLLSHVNQAKYGKWAIYFVAIGELILAVGLIISNELIAVAGGLVIGLGILSHLASLLNYIKHRHRKLELLHGYIFTSVICLITSAVMGILAVTLNISWSYKEKLSLLTVVFLFGWLATALIGHLHKIIPFIIWGVLRKHGVTKLKNKKPVMFSNLYLANIAKLSLVFVISSFVCFAIGILQGSVDIVKVAGIFIFASALTGFANLSITPIVLFLRNRGSKTTHGFDVSNRLSNVTSVEKI